MKRAGMDARTSFTKNHMRSLNGISSPVISTFCGLVFVEFCERNVEFMYLISIKIQ